MTTVFDGLKSERAHLTNENAELQGSLEFSQSEIKDLKAECCFFRKKSLHLKTTSPMSLFYEIDSER